MSRIPKEVELHLRDCNPPPLQMKYRDGIPTIYLAKVWIKKLHSFATYREGVQSWGIVPV